MEAGAPVLHTNWRVITGLFIVYVERNNMRNITIWGFGNAGKYLLQELENRVSCVVENCAYKAQEKDFRVPIVGQSVFTEEYAASTETLIITAQSSKSAFEILDFVDGTNIPNVAILKPSSHRFTRKIDATPSSESSMIWYRTDGITTPIIPRLEVNLIDGCNLNCKGCSHFSAIFSPQSIYKLEDYIAVMNRLRKLGRFVRFRLLGGEPLMVKDLSEYLYETRRVFPEADLEIVTNGLWVDMVDEELWQAISKTDAYFTNYHICFYNF